MIIKKNLLEKIKNSRNQSYTRDFLANAIRNEAKTWKELKHKNIVSFKDFAETENNVYFFLEYCADGYTFPHSETSTCCSRRES